jgi:hypothetical protein
VWMVNGACKHVDPGVMNRNFYQPTPHVDSTTHRAFGWWLYARSEAW